MPNLNELQRKKFIEANEFIAQDPELSSKADEIVEESVRAYYRPINIGGREFQGTIFYLDLYYKVTDKLIFTSYEKEAVDYLYNYVCTTLKLKGFYLHS